MSLVSIIVPIYNVEKYIEKCIESILAQTHQNLEILLIDDGTPDRCGEICDKYAELDKRIQVIHKSNGGLSDARNVGISVATGDYVVFVDGDDFISENLVEYALESAVKHQADVVMFDFYEVEEETNRRDICSMSIEKDQASSLEQNKAYLLTTPSVCNKIFRRTFLIEQPIHFPVGRNYEDLSTTPKLLAKATSIVYMNSEPLYYYVLHTGSIMRSKNFKTSYTQRVAALDDILSYYREQKLESMYHDELEYLVFLHGYFVPSKEIVLVDRKNMYLEKFRLYAISQYKNICKNKYITIYLSRKDKILLCLLLNKQYSAMRVLSSIRKIVDRYRK